MVGVSFRQREGRRADDHGRRRTEQRKATLECLVRGWSEGETNETQLGCVGRTRNAAALLPLNILTSYHCPPRPFLHIHNTTTILSQAAGKASTRTLGANLKGSTNKIRARCTL